MRRLLLLLPLAFAAVAAPAPAAPPNVVVIETDDQAATDMVALPRTRELIGDAGVTFVNAFASMPECCPSRATFLTGQYAHNHGVRAIAPPFGGFRRLRGAETLPVWLKRAGYATGVVGKYLNGYRGYAVPPGWTEFAGLRGASTYRFQGYTMNVDGRLATPAGHQTDGITERAVDFIARRSRRRAPFFLWTTYVAPHVGGPRELFDPPATRTTVPAPRHRLAFFAAPLPLPPSFNEADVSDKPPRLQRRLPLPEWRIAALADVHRQRLASLAAVDEGVARIVGALRAAGELRRTLLVFTSDNGFMTGQHRVPRGKSLAYEPSIRVPLLIRGPGLPRRVRRTQLTWNGDLAPTILEAANARPGLELDGASLLPLARSPRAGRGRDILLEGSPGRRSNGMPRFLGLRTARFKFVKHVRGATELYDLRSDPDETRNLARVSGMARVRARLARRLARLAACAGASCR